MKRRTLTLTLLVACALLSGSLHSQEGHPMIGEAAPEFSLTSVSGETITLSELQGNFVIIHFAASW